MIVTFLYIYIIEKIRCISDITFKSKILNVRIKNDIIVICLIDSVFVLYFDNLKILDHLKTIENSAGLLTMNI